MSPTRMAAGFALARAGIRPRFQALAQVDSGFLEHLLTHLTPPRQAGHHDVGHAAGVDSEDAASGLGPLPRVKRIDQIKPHPRHLDTRIGFAVGERGFHRPQALIEREPRRPGMPGQQLVLLDRGVHTVAECGVPVHHPSASHNPPTEVLASGDVSDPSITIDSHVTRNSVIGAGTAPICPTPPGRVSPASLSSNTAGAADPAHRTAGVNTSTPCCTCCAPDVRGGTCRTTSPCPGRPRTNISCAGAATAPRLESLPRSAARSAPARLDVDGPPRPSSIPPV